MNVLTQQWFPYYLPPIRPNAFLLTSYSVIGTQTVQSLTILGRNLCGSLSTVKNVGIRTYFARVGE